MSDNGLPHGLSRYTNVRYRCRCTVCRAAMAAYMREIRAWRATQPLPDHVAHGTTLAYSSYGCRCDECSAAQRESQRDYRKRNPDKIAAAARAYYQRTHVPAPPRPEPAHGTLGRYQYHRCRCDACREANARWHWLRTQAARGDVPDGVAHGTLNAYGNYGCRCPACRSAKSKANRAYKLARKHEQATP